MSKIYHEKKRCYSSINIFRFQGIFCTQKIGFYCHFLKMLKIVSGRSSIGNLRYAKSLKLKWPKLKSTLLQSRLWGGHIVAPEGLLVVMCQASCWVPLGHKNKCWKFTLKKCYSSINTFRFHPVFSCFFGAFWGYFFAIFLVLR